MKQTPLAAVKARFDITEADPTKARVAAKEKLVAAVRKLADSTGFEDRAAEGKGLEHVSNKKLLRLLDTLTEVEKAGGRDGMLKAILEAEGRSDESFKARFAGWPLPRLWDYCQAAQKRSN